MHVATMRLCLPPKECIRSYWQLTAVEGIGNHSLGMLSISSGCPKQSYYVIKLITDHEVGKEACWGNLGKQIEIEDGYDNTSFYVRMKFSQNM